MPTQTMNSGVQANSAQLDDDNQGVDGVAQQPAEAQERGEADAEQGGKRKTWQLARRAGTACCQISPKSAAAGPVSRTGRIAFDGVP